MILKIAVIRIFEKGSGVRLGFVVSGVRAHLLNPFIQLPLAVLEVAVHAVKHGQYEE
jgi:hypothetical protein